MRFKLSLLALLYTLSCLCSPAFAGNADIDLGDDISLDWLLGDDFKSPQKRREEEKRKQEKKKKEAEQKKKESAQKKKEALDTKEDDMDISLEEKNTAETPKPIKKTNQKQRLSASTKSKKSPLSQNVAEIKAKYAHLDFLTKIRQGLPITTDEMESWIVNTTDVNQCFENGQTMLIYYITRYTDPEPLNLLIESGADIQTHCVPRYEALFISSINNPSAAITEMLISNGANVVDRDYEKNTALILAATFNSSPAVINILLDYGLKTNTVNKYGYTPLMLAAYENGRLPILQTIIDNEADVNAKDPEGHTPLMAAAIRGRDEVMKYLITRGADYRAVDNLGLSVLDYYNKRHYLTTLDFKADPAASPSERMFQEFKFISDNHFHFNNLLKEGVVSENAETVVADALSNLADVDTLDENGCTPLLNATRANKSLAVMTQLVEAEADINAKCLEEQNALMFLSLQSTSSEDVEENIKKAQYLVENGLDINATDSNGNTALMYAVAHNADNKFILNLINLGANINAQNKLQESALWMAVRAQNRSDTLKLLLEYGADVNQTDARNETPLWFQLRNGGDEKTTITLLKGGANANILNGAGDLPLWYAFTNDAPIDVIAEIIRATDDVNLKNEDGDTPLLFAVKNDYPATIIKALFEKGANPEIADRNGFTMYDVMQGSQFFDETMQKRNRQRVLEDW